MNKDYKSKKENLKKYRQNFDNFYQEISDYFLPRRDFTINRSIGTNRKKALYDELGIVMVESLASALHSMLTPKSSMWGKLRSYGARDSVNNYYSSISRELFNYMQSPKRGLYRSLHECFLDVVAFGTCIMFIGKVEKTGDVYVQSRNLKDCHIAEDDYGNIDTVYYECKMKKWELVRRFGEESLSKKILDEKDDRKEFSILHIVEPREVNMGKGSIKTKKPFANVYYDCDNDHVIYEGGYDEFPYAVGRFQKRSGEVYGYSPAMETLSTIKMRNTIKEIMIRGGTKAVDPPILSPAEGLFSPYKLDAGSVVYYDPSLPTPNSLNTNYRPDYFEYLLTKSSEHVERIFYTNWMNMPSQPNMTATEVIQRAQESLRMLTPMLSRLEAEFLSVIVRRIYSIMDENKKFKSTKPRDLDDSELIVEFVSPMNQAQRITNANNVLQGLGFTLQAAQGDSSAMNVINFTKLVRDGLINNYNWDINHIRSEDEVKQIQNQQQALAQAQQLSEIASNTAGSIGGLGGV